MKQDNKTTMELALEWWKGLRYVTTPYDLQNRHRLTEKYYPTKSASFLKATEIENIYLSEHPEQAIKEADLTTGSPDSTNPVHSFLVEENRRLKERVEVLEDALKYVLDELNNGMDPEDLTKSERRILTKAKQVINQK